MKLKKQRPSKVSDELIRMDLTSSNDNDRASNKKRKLERHAKLRNIKSVSVFDVKEALRTEGTIINIRDFMIALRNHDINRYNHVTHFST